MSEQRPSDPRPPSPEQLAAYVDGELPPAVRLHVEAWLAGHPEVAAELAGHEKLLRLWQQTSPPEPAEPQWARALADVRARWTGQADAAPPAKGGSSRWPAAALGTAAAVLLATLLFGLKAGHRPTPPDVEALPVASADDVEIVSIDGGDVHTLVVGRPPLHEPVVLVSVGDVRLESVEPDVDGMLPQVRMADGTGAPMIVAPLEAGPARQP